MVMPVNKAIANKIGQLRFNGFILFYNFEIGNISIFDQFPRSLSSLIPFLWLDFHVPSGWEWIYILEAMHLFNRLLALSSSYVNFISFPWGVVFSIRLLNINFISFFLLNYCFSGHYKSCKALQWRPEKKMMILKSTSWEYFIFNQKDLRCLFVNSTRMMTAKDERVNLMSELLSGIRNKQTTTS